VSTDSIAFLDLPDGRSLIGYGPFRTMDAPPARGAAFYRNDFGLGSASPWWIPARWELRERGDPARLPAATPEPSACTWEAPDASAFAAVFQEISAAIRAGSFEKTVPVVVERGRLTGPPGHSLLAAAAGCSEPLIGYGFSDGREGFAGATPERLFSLSGRVLRTMALAGTARSEERDVLAVDEKEIREHEYVAQSLVSKLGDIGHVTRGPREIMGLGSIVHFHTPFEVALSGDETPDALVRRLHPTSALFPALRRRSHS
jgi:menaquinone-specific isochorismate synthase